MKTQKQIWFLFALAFLFIGSTARSDGDPATDSVPRYIPYQGSLQRDGQPVNGTLSMGFRLYDGATATNPAWSETLSVPLYEGRFSVILGSSSAQSVVDLSRVISQADDVYLEVVIDPDGAATVLNGRQRFLPVPYAIWTTAATDFSVGRKLTVNGGAEIHGVDNDGSQAALKVHSSNGDMLIDSNEIDSTNDTLYLNHNSQKPLEVGGDTEINGKFNVSEDAALQKNLTIFGTDVVFGDNPDRGPGGRALVHDGNDSLVINYHGDLSGGTKVDSPLYVNGSLTSSRSGCRADSCDGMSWKNVNGGQGWGSWRGRTYCPAHTFVCGLEQRVEGDQGDGDDTAVNDIAIICCPL